MSMPAPGVDLDRIDAAIMAEIARLRRDGITEEERAQTVERLTAGRDSGRDSLTWLAGKLARARAIGRPIRDVVEADGRLRRPPLAKINQIAARWFDPSAFAITHLLPKAAP